MCSFLYFSPASPMFSLLYSLLDSFVDLPFGLDWFYSSSKTSLPLFLAHTLLCWKICSSKIFFWKSDKKCCWFSAAKPYDIMRAVGGFTACVKIWAGLSFLANMFTWLSLILCIRRSQTQNKIFNGLGEFLSIFCSAFFS